MPAWMVSFLVQTIIEQWSGKLERYKADSLRSNGLYDALFCDQNYRVASLIVLKAHFSPIPKLENGELIDMAKVLLNEKEHGRDLR